MTNDRFLRQNKQTRYAATGLQRGVTENLYLRQFGSPSSIHLRRWTRRCLYVGKRVSMRHERETRPGRMSSEARETYFYPLEESERERKRKGQESKRRRK